MAFRDNLKTRNDFPVRRKSGSLSEPGPRRLAGPDDDRLAKQPARHFGWQGIQDNLEGCRVRHMPVTLPVNKFGLDSQVFGFREKVHSARCLHGKGQGTS
jgi:hypothetical protein